MSASKGSKEKKSAGTGSSSGGSTKEEKPSPALAKIVGDEPLLRTEVTKKVWDYIQEHNLQDPQDKRRIRADRKLKAIFDGKDSVTILELTRAVNSHLGGGVVVRPGRKKPSMHLGGGVVVKPKREME
jgi:upstream activation factor subunit UAF30